MNFYFLSKSILPGDDLWANSGMNEQESTGLYENDFIGGISLRDRAMELPIRVEIKSKGRIMPGAFFFPFTLREDLVADLLEFGLDNLEFYDAILVDDEMNKTWTNFKVCNVVGLVDVFDMQKSELHPDSPPDGAYLFNEIVINKDNAAGHHIFRPYGRKSKVIVSEALKNYLESKGKYDFFDFIAPEDFA